MEFRMADVTKEQVLEKLKGVRGPDMDGNIVDMGLVSDVFISDSKVYFSITVPAERARELDPLRAAAERVVKEIPGVKGAMVALTADKKATASQAPVTEARCNTAARRAFPRGACACGCARPAPRRSGKGRHSGRRCDHRCCFRQGRRWQVDDLGQSCSGAEGQRSARRHSRCGYLRPVDAAATENIRPSAADRRPDDPADGKLRAEGHVDGLPRRRGSGDDLARADDPVGAAADAAGSCLGRTRRARRRHAARAPATRS